MTALTACVGSTSEGNAPGQTDAAATTTTTATTASPTWWTALRQSQLDRLVSDALAQNLDIGMALARIDEAAANATAAGARLQPSLSADGFAGRADLTSAGADSTWSASLKTGWTIDLFGGVRASRDAALSRLKAAEFTEQATRLLISGAVSEAYVDLRYFQESLELNRLSIDSIQTTRKLIASSFEQGGSSQLEVLQVEQLLAKAEAKVPALKAGQTAALLRLATLTNQPVEMVSARLAGGARIPTPKFSPRGGVAADVIRSRPDVLAAEQTLLAAASDVGVARADLYPSLSLTGRITALSVGGGSASDTWSFGPSINLPIFSGGALRANLRGAEARAELARLEWQDSVLSASEEAGTAMSAILRAGEEVVAQEDLVQLSKQVLELNRESYLLGESDLLSLLDSERSLLDARLASAAAQRARAAAFIRLSIAVAGRLGDLGA